MTEISIHTSKVDRGRVMVRLKGELDIASAGKVEQAMLKHEEGCRELILDLRDLGFIDSTGLRLVISAHTRAEAGGWGLSIVPGPERVHRVFQVAGLEDRLPFSQARADAGNSD